MKILQVLPALEQGGVERGTIEIAAALKSAGIPNAVASSGGRLVAKLEAMGVEHFKLPLDSKLPWVVRKNGDKLAKIVRDGDFSLIHVRSRAPAWSVRRAARLAGVEFIATWHGLYGTDPKWLKIPYNRIMLSGKLTIAVSECVRNHILSIYGADPEKVVCIHRGADTEKFFPGAVAESAVSEFLFSQGIESDWHVITLPGRLTYWKGQRELISAVGKMRHGKVAVLLVGSDQGRTEYTQSLKTLAAALPADRKVVFLEHSENMPLVYAASEVVVSASSAQPEAFGRVIPEAQAMGRIVVGTAHGGACETVQSGETGFLVKPGDVDELAAALDHALDLSPDERQRMSERSVASVRERFSTRRMCEKTIAVYRGLFGE